MGTSAQTCDSPAWDRQAVEHLIEQNKNQPGALLPILHAIQDALGYVPNEAVPAIAKALNLSRAEVHGVVSFYHWYRQEPRGKHTVYVCRAESCQAMGGKALEEAIKTQLGIDYHETTADSAITLEPIYCLGNCACSPAIMVDREFYGRVSADSFKEIAEELRGTAS